MAKLLILISEHSYNINYEKYLRFTQSECYTETRQSHLSYKIAHYTVILTVINTIMNTKKKL